MFPSLTVHHVIRTTWSPVAISDVAVVIKAILRTDVGGLEKRRCKELKCTMCSRHVRALYAVDTLTAYSWYV